MLVVNSYVFYRMQNMCVHKHHSSSSSCTYAANIRKFWKPLFKAQPPLSEAEKLFLLNCQNATSLNPSKELVETFGRWRSRFCAGRLRSAFLSSEGFDTGIKCLRDVVTLGSNKREFAAEAVAETGKVVTIAGIFRLYRDVVMDASPSCQQLRIFRVEARVRKATTELQRYESDLQAKEAEVYRCPVQGPSIPNSKALDIP